MKFLQFLLKILNLFEDHSGRLPPSRKQASRMGLTLSERKNLKRVTQHKDDRT